MPEIGIRTAQALLALAATAFALLLPVATATEPAEILWATEFVNQEGEFEVNGQVSLPDSTIPYDFIVIFEKLTDGSRGQLKKVQIDFQDETIAVEYQNLTEIKNPTGKQVLKTVQDYMKQFRRSPGRKHF